MSIKDWGCRKKQIHFCSYCIDLHDFFFWFTFALNCFVQVFKCLHRTGFWLWLLRWTMLDLKNLHSSGRKYQKLRSWNTGKPLCCLFNLVSKYVKKYVHTVDFSVCLWLKLSIRLWQWTCRLMTPMVWLSILWLSHRLRCHVLESIKPTVSPLRNSLPDIAISGQQDLDTVVSSGGREALLL